MLLIVNASASRAAVRTPRTGRTPVTHGAVGGTLVSTVVQNQACGTIVAPFGVPTAASAHALVEHDVSVHGRAARHHRGIPWLGEPNFRSWRVACELSAGADKFDCPTHCEFSACELAPGSAGLGNAARALDAASRACTGRTAARASTWLRARVLVPIWTLVRICAAWPRPVRVRSQIWPRAAREAV
jgi:hypothetical protein